jgi:ABC-type cobalamin/Fe3+-siderophores transport system ATPase subunit
VSLYVEWVNQIKAKATSAWLTKGQRTAFESIVTKWQSHPFVCLYGPPGCGKSFIARLLSSEQGYLYVNDLNNAEQDVEQVVLDGGEYSRMMRPVVSMLGIRRVVVVMRQMPRDTMPKAHVVLDEYDTKQFQHNLYEHRILQSFLANVSGTNFERILQAEAVERIT